MDGEPSVESILDETFSGAVEPKPTEPASAPKADEPVTPAVTPSEPQAGPSVEPLAGRLRAAGISDGDIDQVRRYYERAMQGRGDAPAAPADPWKSVADKLMSRYDQQTRMEHAQWRRQYGDEAYVAAVHRSEGQEPKPEPDEDEKALDDRIGKAIERALSSRFGRFERDLAETSAERAERRLREDLSPIMDGLKVPAHVREFFLQDVRREVARIAATNPDTSLTDLARQRWSTMSEMLDSERKAAIDGLRSATRPATPPGRQAPASMPAPSNPTSKGPQTIDEVMDETMAEFDRSLPPEGAA